MIANIPNWMDTALAVNIAVVILVGCVLGWIIYDRED